ncbi:MAG: hypothetical protein ABI054_13070 [Planctomycetota bacterium]
MKSIATIVGLLCLAAACQSQPPRPLLRGDDYRGWHEPVGAEAAHWQLRDGKLECQAPAAPIWTEADFGDCEITLDVRVLEGHPTAVLFARGPQGFQVALEPRPTGQWSRIRAKFEGEANDIDIDRELSAGVMPGVAKHGPIGLSTEGGGRVEFANVMVRDLH